MSDSDADVAARLAILEERTKPKSKNWMDYIKDWSGLISALVVIGISYPIGAWNFFIVSPKAKVESEVQQLRDVVLQLSDLEARYAQYYSGIREPQLKSFYSNAMGSQCSAIIARSLELLKKRHSALTVQEEVLLGYNLGQAGLYDDSDKVLRSAQNKAIEHNSSQLIQLVAETHRLQGMSYSTRGGADQKAKTRAAYAASIHLLLAMDGDAPRLQAANTAFEWSLIELRQGDQLCGERLAQWARQTLDRLRMIGPAAADMLATYEDLSRRVIPADTLSRDGCPATETEWLQS